jgi:hypothetical protein
MHFIFNSGFLRTPGAVLNHLLAHHFVDRQLEELIEPIKSESFFSFLLDLLNY